MTTYYKLTDAKDCTRGRMQWGKGVTHKATGTGGLCTDGVIHAYRDPLLAVLMDPIHGCYGAAARLWEAESMDRPADDGAKIGLRSLTTIRRIPLPTPSLSVRVRFAIYAARQLPQPPEWKTWAERWCAGTDRTGQAAARDASDADAAARAAYAAAAHAYAAAYAADAAARAASDTYAALEAAEAAARAASDALEAAFADATRAAHDKDGGVRIGAVIDLVTLAHQAAADEAPSPAAVTRERPKAHHAQEGRRLRKSDKGPAGG